MASVKNFHIQAKTADDMQRRFVGPTIELPEVDFKYYDKVMENALLSACGRIMMRKNVYICDALHHWGRSTGRVCTAQYMIKCVSDSIEGMFSLHEYIGKKYPALYLDSYDYDRLRLRWIEQMISDLRTYKEEERYVCAS